MYTVVADLVIIQFVPDNVPVEQAYEAVAGMVVAVLTGGVVTPVEVATSVLGTTQLYVRVVLL